VFEVAAQHFGQFRPLGRVHGSGLRVDGLAAFVVSQHDVNRRDD
jgi:hypothetical protein